MILEVLGRIRKRPFGCQQDFYGIGIIPPLCAALQKALGFAIAVWFALKSLVASLLPKSLPSEHFDLL